MCFGTAHLIEDPAEKERARQHGRPLLSRPRGVAAHQPVPELKATTVIGMTIDEASAKVRSKGVADEEEDYGLPIYAARFPVRRGARSRPPAHASERRAARGLAVSRPAVASTR